MPGLSDGFELNVCSNVGKPPEVAFGDIDLWIVVGAGPLRSSISKAGLEKDVLGASGALDVVF